MWRRPRGIAEVYRLTGDSLYRHAVAFDLYSQRRNNLRSVLDNIMERGIETEITGETILGAVKAYTSLDDSNRWIEPATNVIFSTKPAEARAQLSSIPIAALPDAMIDVGTGPQGVSRVTNYESQIIASNRNSQELKIDASS